MRQIAFLGPRGTFSEEAMLSLPELAAAEHLPKGSIPEVIAAVESGEADCCVVPLENAIEGSIDLTLDALVFGADVLIRHELIRPISLNLVTRPGTRLRDVTEVVSIPVVAGQSRGWLAKHLPRATIVAANSTAAAVERVARSRRSGLAAIGNRLAAERLRLEVIAAEIEDHPENATRFGVVGRGVPAPTGHDKTMIVCFQREDRPGSLLAILQEFAARAINLTALHSRPAKTGLGRYCFVIEFEGHLADELVADALRDLAAKHGRIKFLGSYPVADSEAGHERRRAASRAWRDAERWVDDLRAQIDRAG
ncbi:MAG: prephenate dehydratase [Gaiellales bacterium]